MSVRALLVTFASLLLTDARGLAQALTVDDVFASVAEHHPRLARERARIASAAGELEAARGAFDPRLRVRGTSYATGAYPSRRLELGAEAQTPFYGLSVLGEYRLTSGYLPVYDGRAETLDRGELRLTARMPFMQDFLIDAPRAARARADLDVDLAEAQLAASRLELERGAVTAYYRWWLAGRAREVMALLVDLAERRNAQLGRLAEVGSISRVEARENERALLQRGARLVAAEQRLAQAAVQLSLFLRDEEGAPRVPESAELPPDGPPTAAVPAELDSLVEEAFEARPELASLRLQIRRGDVAADLARTGRLPRLDLQVSVSQDVGSGTADQRDRLAAPVVEAGFSVSSPVPNRTGTGRLDAREADISALDAEYGFTREQIRVQVAEARVAVVASIEAVRLEQASLTIARELAAAEWRRFEEGATTLLMVNLREQIAAETELSLAERRAELAIADALLALAVGRLGARPSAAPAGE